MPILISSVLMLLYLTFFVHNSAALTANAAEAAVTGRTIEVPHYMAAVSPTLSMEKSRGKRTVSYTDQVVNWNGALFGTLNHSVTYQIYDPTGVIRCRQIIKEN